MEFRKVLFDTLKSMMLQDEKICVLDADLAKPNGTYPLYTLFPQRCFNVGIAEANMVSIAAGLSAYDFKPVVITFAPFATRRAFDQIAVSVAYAKRKIVIIGTDPGITAETNGGTHMSFEDVAIMRSIPDFVIYDAPDPEHFGQMLPGLINSDKSVYIRIPRKDRPSCFQMDSTHSLMKSSIIQSGTELTLIASGTEVYEALQACSELKHLSIELISLNFVKPLDEDTLLASIRKTGRVLVCENHNIIGGAFSAIAEMCALKYPVMIASIGVDDRFGQVGSYGDLLKEYRLTKDDIIRKILEVIQ